MKTNVTTLNAVDTGILGAADVNYCASSDKVKIRVTCSGDVMTVFADCAEQMTFSLFSLTAAMKYADDCRIFVNGFQSWTDSIEYPKNTKQYAPAPLMRKFAYGKLAKKIGLSVSGDYDIYKAQHSVGRFYGFSYGYVRTGDKITVLGSLDDSTGYTIFDFDAANGKLTVTVDLKGRQFSAGENVIAKIAKVQGGYDEAFDKYFALTGVRCRPCPLKKGYTTWYNYYTNIDASIIERDLDALADCGCETDVFQIDDGYQRAIGDWLTVKSDFYTVLNDVRTDKSKETKTEPVILDVKDGMRPIADMIHKKDMLAGLWLAPFAVSPLSEVFKEHKDWLIVDEKGVPRRAGNNWGGFYALNIYNEEVRAYIKKVFDTVLNEWGFDLVKLDFLYAAAIEPLNGNCRAKVMYDAMDLLRECVGDKLILGCGVPLMPAFGKVDYCRIGADISLKWYKNNYDIREGVSTSHAVANSAFRRHLDGRAFGNDPDVFLLRNGNLNMTFKQKTALAEINKLFGSVLFTSDNVDDYNDLQIAELRHVFDGRRAKIIDVSFSEKHVLSVRYDYGDGEKLLEIALYDGAINKDGEHFDLTKKLSLSDLFIDKSVEAQQKREDKAAKKSEKHKK